MDRTSIKMFFFSKLPSIFLSIFLLLKFLSTNSILIIITINSWAADCNRVSLSKNSNIVLSKLHLNSFPFVRYPVVVSTLFLFNPAFYYYEMKKCIFWPRVHDRFILFFLEVLRFCKMGWNHLLPFHKILFVCLLRRPKEFGVVFHFDLTFDYLTSISLMS